MKTRIILAVLVGLLGFQTANADIKKSTNDWTKKSETPTLRGNAIGTESAADPVVPIEDAVPCICLLAGVYLTYSLLKKCTK
jgi:hypothetical protein